MMTMVQFTIITYKHLCIYTHPHASLGLLWPHQRVATSLTPLTPCSSFLRPPGIAARPCPKISTLFGYPFISIAALYNIDLAHLQLALLKNLSDYRV